MGNRKFFPLFIFLGLGMGCFGQIGSVISNGRIYEKPLREKKNAPFSTEGLAFEITKNATSDAEKVSRIYKWISANISYDNELHQSTKLQKEFYTSEENVLKKVLERKMAICGGMAFLFKELCKNVGISSEVVHGHTKSYGATIRNGKKPNHTWNAVKLNGKWQLLDITWAISHGAATVPDDFWFLTRPAEFILSHYPENEKWTLLKNPVSFLEFQKSASR